MKPDLIKVSTVKNGIPPIIKINGNIYKTSNNTDVIIK